MLLIINNIFTVDMSAFFQSLTLIHTFLEEFFFSFCTVTFDNIKDGRNYCDINSTVSKVAI